VCSGADCRGIYSAFYSSAAISVSRPFSACISLRIGCAHGPATCNHHEVHSTLRRMTRMHSWRIKRRGVNNVRSTLFSMPTAKLTGVEWSGKCRVQSPESRVQSGSTFRNPHFIVLGIWRGFGIKAPPRYKNSSDFGSLTTLTPLDHSVLRIQIL